MYSLHKNTKQQKRPRIVADYNTRPRNEVALIYHSSAPHGVNKRKPTH